MFRIFVSLHSSQGQLGQSLVAPSSYLTQTPRPRSSHYQAGPPAMAAGRVDAASMVAVGLVWGATNALMRRGALVWDRRARASPSSSVLRRWAALLVTWQYSAPFAANLCASAAFFALLGAAPISVAVPVTNAVTFAATAVAAAILGERVRPAPAALGTALIVLGVWICIS
ncbi:hypothetical protein PAHAL_7G019100 [Panicum hallii]|uniref:Uncharacterized protein n=2 Tax=Panicum hallii TaxID=206008 RepID=A0A2T8IAN8_9POAL|nr:hypothetical protein PAHAL_7G019100 [Panicum hallii]